MNASRRIVWTWLVIWGLISLPINQVDAQERNPKNVVVFLVDDLGWADLGCYGSTFYETPAIDALASASVQFSDGYAACPVCSPSRAAMLTGLWPVRTGITDYIGAAGGQAWKRNTRLLPADYQQQLGQDFTNLAEICRAAGMATFFAGKWHLGGEAYWPEQQGFDINLGGIDRGGPYGGKKYFSPYGNPRLPDGPEGEHLPERLGRETAGFIERSAAAQQPFLAYLSFYSVHTPLIAREDLRQYYEGRRERLAEVDRFGQEPPRDHRLSQDHAIYAAMVTAMDAAVGVVVDALEKAGIRDETLIIFTSDNGGLATSEGHPTSNLPLRAGKGWMYEGGIRVPLIVAAPGVDATVSRIPACGVDVLPTIVDALQIDHRLQVDGRSLWPLLQGDIAAADSLATRPLFWHYPHYGNQGGAPASAVRRGDWKLIRWYEGKEELFNLGMDLGERHNLIEDRPYIAAELSQLLDGWLEETRAAMPTTNADYDPQHPDGRYARR